MQNLSVPHARSKQDSLPEYPAPISESTSPSDPALAPLQFDFWDSLDSAVELDIQPLTVDWTRLVALHRTEHEEDEDENVSAMEVRAQPICAYSPDVTLTVMQITVRVL